ncbi:integrase_H2C2 domain-containing protein [Trichonephila inaurata madagascariensis]|uniref:Integrase_H2C2 domain-containing protein n=1 Tax=Trichonephila inaurata madagascariensis TaxID=2747483 RepID=A0A8X6WTL5_9ARAC|nr:integrase_H2C2 domain-containing protein [Trichonephila inaurata madagascariensis]
MESSRPWQVKRAGLRTSFTKTANVLKAELVNVEFSVDFPEENDRSRLTNLMKFLKTEKRLMLARGGLDSINRKEDYHDKVMGGVDSKFKFKKQASVPTATGFLVTKDHTCIFCGKMHESKNCYIARELSVDERISKAKEKRCCLKCLEPNHIASFVNSLLGAWHVAKHTRLSYVQEWEVKWNPQQGDRS